MEADKVYNKHFAINSRDTDWGFEIHYCGYAFVEPFEKYPSRVHFRKSIHLWETGRVLNTYCILYIRQGEGFFQTKGIGVSPVKAGTLIFLYPGVWHRYKPNEKTGWKEYWIAFDGYYPRYLMRKNFFPQKEPFVHVGTAEAIIKDFSFIMSTSRVESFGIRQIIAGVVLQLLGKIYVISKQNIEESTITADIIKRTVLIMEENPETFNFSALVNNENISYTWFRRMFKKYTGFSPNQYHIQLRVQKAKDFLSLTHMSIKEVALDAGFKSSYYFTRLFKQKTGLTPSQYRKKSWGKK